MKEKKIIFVLIGLKHTINILKKINFEFIVEHYLNLKKCNILPNGCKNTCNQLSSQARTISGKFIHAIKNLLR